MTRVLSGAILVALAVGAVWFAPSWMFETLAAVVALLAVFELSHMAGAAGLVVPTVPAAAASLIAVVAVSRSGEGTRIPLDAVLMAASVAIMLVMLGAWGGVGVGDGVGARTGAGAGAWKTTGSALASTSAALFPMLYVALPVGGLVAIRARDGAAALFLLMLTVMVSDTAQYYTGRLVGRRKLAPAISPHKTIEGAFGGLVFGTSTFTLLGGQWMPRIPPGERIGLGAALVAAGIAGDLFESMLKRSAGVKDSSTLIPGHGGILDRIDALLFAAPVYYIFLKYA